MRSSWKKIVDPFREIWDELRTPLAGVSVVVLSVFAYTAYTVNEISAKVHNFEDSFTRVKEPVIMSDGIPPVDAEEPMNDYLENTWTSGGQQVTVRTSLQDGETEEELIARHVNRVEKMQEAFPPD